MAKRRFGGKEGTCCSFGIGDVECSKIDPNSISIWPLQKEKLNTDSKRAQLREEMQLLPSEYRLPGVSSIYEDGSKHHYNRRGTIVLLTTAINLVRPH